MKYGRGVQPVRRADASRCGQPADRAETSSGLEASWPVRQTRPSQPALPARWKIAGLLTAIVLMGIVLVRVLPIAVAQDSGQAASDGQTPAADVTKPPAKPP